MKLRPKVFSLVLGILVVSFVVLSVPLYWYARSALEEELDKRLLTVCRIVEKDMNKDLLRVLVQEPSLSNVRATLEKELSAFAVENVMGIAVYGRDGTVLAGTHKAAPVLLQAFAETEGDLGERVSEIYELGEGDYFKAAAVTVSNPPAVVVVWAGAEFMTVIDEIAGSLLWIILITLVAAISLAVVFSRSLIRPVRALSRYARSIQRNIYSKPVDLGRNDEFGDLNRSLSDMHADIRQHEQSTKQLLSGIAHEIKNPLGGMEIYTGLLEEELSNQSDHQSYLEKITGELHHLKQIVLEYLDYARPLKGDLKKVPLESILEDAYRILMPEIKQKKVNYSLKGKGTVVGDESKLRRVFVNLLKNSVEAVDKKGSISVTLEGKDNTVGIKISDNGTGIPEENLSNIFQPYFTTQDKGYGLGLAIAKNIIDEMNGTILVESQVGKGTTFSVEIPVNRDT